MNLILSDCGLCPVTLTSESNSDGLDFPNGTSSLLPTRTLLLDRFSESSSECISDNSSLFSCSKPTFFKLSLHPKPNSFLCSSSDDYNLSDSSIDERNEKLFIKIPILKPFSEISSIYSSNYQVFHLPLDIMNNFTQKSYARIPKIVKSELDLLKKQNLKLPFIASSFRIEHIIL